ncbi:MAG: Type 1 glutamine amidotransferase-like domain-containing protein [Candidatus Nanopelagicales bacterium]|nr:Type 1 glutamine amidotransferase-like domain-containing protein [Candidatus Nanopelagicales bacterium]
MTPGPIALVGSGEYLPIMQEVEANLIAGRNPIYVQIPTAAAPEGERSLSRWIELGKAQANRIGVTAVSVVAHDRNDAQDPRIAELVRDAGLIYLSGGNPTFLANTLRDTLLWQEIEAAWRNGAALAGCSAGAMALADHIPALRLPTHSATNGGGLLPHLRVLPHFDQMFARLPDFLTRFMKVPDGVSIVGIDEETAIIGGPFEWEVKGRQSAWLFVDGHRKEFKPGETLITPGIF